MFCRHEQLRYLAKICSSLLLANAVDFDIACSPRISLIRNSLTIHSVNSPSCGGCSNGTLNQKYINDLNIKGRYKNRRKYDADVVFLINSPTLLSCKRHTQCRRMQLAVDKHKSLCSHLFSRQDQTSKVNNVRID